MPAFCKNEGFRQMEKTFRGQTVLTARQVEDLMAYLMTLK